MSEKEILGLLASVVHPETGEDLVAADMVRGLMVDGANVRFTIALKRVRDPFAASLKREASRQISEAFPLAQITVSFEEPAAKSRQATPRQATDAPQGIGCVLAIASGKGGVGKSTITANLAITLCRMGYRVGILDADIYGPSQPALFGVEEYVPPVEKREQTDFMLPAQAHGVKIMSIGFFISPSDALVWRGPMATSALKQLIHQTLWGDLDYLLIDMPPGTGDVHLTVLQEMRVAGAVVVTTPQAIALADVVRGIAMFRAEKIGIPVLGIVENMAWFTPAELPGNRYYVFGREGAMRLAEEQKLPLLCQIPLVLPAGQEVGGGLLGDVDNADLADAYTTMVQKVITAVKC